MQHVPSKLNFASYTWGVPVQLQNYCPLIIHKNNDNSWCLPIRAASSGHSLIWVDPHCRVNMKLCDLAKGSWIVTSSSYTYSGMISEVGDTVKLARVWESSCSFLKLWKNDNCVVCGFCFRMWSQMLQNMWDASHD